jgi:hypothetical protein
MRQLGYTYTRIDGTMSADDRIDAMESSTVKGATRSKLLASSYALHACGTGINFDSRKRSLHDGLLVEPSGRTGNIFLFLPLVKKKINVLTLLMLPPYFLCRQWIACIVTKRPYGLCDS